MATFAETADSSHISKGLNKETLSWFQMWGNKPQEKGRQLLKASKQDSYRPEVNGLLSDSLSGPSLVGHVLTARNLPLLNLHHHQRYVFVSEHVEGSSSPRCLIQQKHSCLPWPPNTVLEEMPKVKKSNTSPQVHYRL